jgi:hypothetical protein
MRKTKALVLGVILVAASSASTAGGCLQGTWTYYDDDGSFVGYETVGCGADDGVYGQVTDNKTFSQGCVSPI